MKTAVFTIKDHSDIGKTINYLHNNYTQANFENKPLVVEIKPFDGDRSKAQNRLYWKFLSQWSKHQGTDKDSEHLFFKKKFLARIYDRDDVGQYRKTFAAVRKLKEEQHSMYQQVADGLNELISTTDASIAQFTEYLNDIHTFCLKQGCYLETPDDLKYVLE
ncbi:TPA: hypothetical protein NU643_000755 [Acinetobacter baumannii]|uniref:hypothetical protein n=1 Tax=Acinetobacter baumannii TaxID=470 RepID=UPI00165F6333|nr:hypothetical protein [Acinetobacter baumannii]MBD0085367.1 hypothetical protein [Acinetobacter baumannii]MBD0159509.1 hypothetical protein [Acinetobacter baumannii]HAV3044405.1 hypothetical protein [Acinetobacter baumannii]HBO4585255.1 hypothetical protein [Acinetobacter baumannii]HCJ6408176.1 hypothetical protein [Acinetobacter baumannii]